jgi:hypothetical protein
MSVIMKIPSSDVYSFAIRCGNAMRRLSVEAERVGHGCWRVDERNAITGIVDEMAKKCARASTGARIEYKLRTLEL